MLYTKSIESGGISMDIKRKELAPGVFLNYLQSDKFKTACMSVTLLTQLDRDTVYLNALLPHVLRRGTVRYPNMESIAARLDELYGTAIEPVTRRIGEIHCLGFYASVPENCFLPAGTNVLRDAAMLMGEMLLQPATRAGLLNRDYVESEKEKLSELVRSRINEKRIYAVTRCIEEMCCCEEYSVGRYSDADNIDNIYYQKLSKYYRKLIQTAPVEVFYIGRESLRTVSNIFSDVFAAMPRGEINYDIGTDVRMNALEDEVRSVTECMDVQQGKLVMGFRLGECMEEPDAAAINVFNCVFGSGVTSKLFMNVREKLRLCYYASSFVDRHKGLMFVSSGIEFDKFDEAKDEILAQLEAVRNGDITDEELNAAKKGVASDLYSAMDSQGELEGYYLSQTLEGLDYSPVESAALVEDVTKEDIIKVAQGVELDLIYFLKGEEEEDDE